MTNQKRENGEMGRVGQTEENVAAETCGSLGRVALLTNTVAAGAFSAVFAGMAWALKVHDVEHIDVLFYQGIPNSDAFPEDVKFVKLAGGRGMKVMTDLRRYLDRVKPDFLISGPTYVNLLAIVASAFSGWRWRGGKLVITHHHPIDLAHQENKKNNKWMVKALYRFASGSFGVSPGSVSDACRHAHLDPRRVPCIPNVLVPVEPSKHSHTHLWLDEKMHFTFLTVSRLVASKNIGLLIRAFDRIAMRSSARLLVVGDGVERDRLAAMVESLGLRDRVALCGFVDSPRLFMEKADAFVLASDEEGFGQVLTEAMSMGCPVISTRALGGGAEFVLDGGKCGLLVPCGDEDELVEAMLKMMNAQVRQEYANKARHRARRFLPEYVGRELVRFLGSFSADATKDEMA